MTKIAGSASGSGSISTRHGSADPDPDPDPPQNVMDPQHWKKKYGTYQDTCLSCCALWTPTVFCPDTRQSVLLPPHCRAGPRSAQSQRVAPPCTARTFPVLSSSDSCLSVREKYGAFWFMLLELLSTIPRRSF